MYSGHHLTPREKGQRTTQRGRNEAAGEEQKVCEYRKTIEEKNVWKTPQRKINNKPRRVIEERIEAVEEQMINNNPINNSPKDHKKMTESCKTPKRKYKMNPRRINKVPEEIKEARDEQKRRNLIEAGEEINNNLISNNPKDPKK